MFVISLGVAVSGDISVFLEFFSRKLLVSVVEFRLENLSVWTLLFFNASNLTHFLAWSLLRSRSFHQTFTVQRIYQRIQPRFIKQTTPNIFRLATIIHRVIKTLQLLRHSILSTNFPEPSLQLRLARLQPLGWLLPSSDLTIIITLYRWCLFG